jgi:hypothetical protein
VIPPFLALNRVLPPGIEKRMAPDAEIRA